MMRSSRFIPPCWTSPGLVPGFSLSDGRLMEHIRILLLVPLLAIATASEADTQTDRAAQIETLL